MNGWVAVRSLLPWLGGIVGVGAIFVGAYLVAQAVQDADYDHWAKLAVALSALAIVAGGMMVLAATT